MCNLIDKHTYIHTGEWESENLSCNNRVQGENGTGHLSRKRWRENMICTIDADHLHNRRHADGEIQGPGRLRRSRRKSASRPIRLARGIRAEGREKRDGTGRGR